MSDSWIDKDELKELLGGFSDSDRKLVPRDKPEPAELAQDEPVDQEPVERLSLWTAPGTSRPLKTRASAVGTSLRATGDDLFSNLNQGPAATIINDSSDVTEELSTVGTLPTAAAESGAWFAPASPETSAKNVVRQAVEIVATSDEEESRKANSLLQRTRAQAELAGLLDKSDQRQVSARDSREQEDTSSELLKSDSVSADSLESEISTGDLLPRILVDNERTQWFLRDIEDWVEEDEAEPFQALTEKGERAGVKCSEEDESGKVTDEQGQKTKGALVDRLQDFALELAEVLDARNVELFDRDGYPLLPVQRAEVFRSFPRKELQFASMKLCEAEILDDFAVSQVRNVEHGWACLLPCWARDPRFFVCFDREHPLDDIEVTTWRKELSRVVLGPTVATGAFSPVTN